MRNYLLCFLFFIFTLQTFAQAPANNSEDEFTDSTMLNDFTEPVAKNKHQPFGQNQKFNEQRLKLDIGIGNHKGAGVTANNLGWIAMKNKDYGNAMRYFTMALDEFTKGKAARGIAGAQAEIANVYRINGDYALALSNFSNALALMKNNKMQHAIARVTNSMAEIYSAQKDHEKAYIFFRDAGTKFSELGDQRELSDVNIRTGEELIALGRENEALDFLNNALKQKEESTDSIGKSITLRDIGIIYFRRNDYTKALDFFQRSLKASEQLQVLKLVRDTYLKLYAESQVNMQSGKEELFNKQYRLYKDTVQSILNSRALSPDSLSKEVAEKDRIADLLNKKKEEKIKTLDVSEIEVSRKMTDAELERLKTEQAVEELSKEKRQDELEDKERNEQIQQLQKDKAAQELALSQKQLEQARQRLLIYLLTGIAILILFSLGFVYVRYRNDKKSHEALDKAYAELSSTHARLKNMQTQLVHSEKMASLGQLTAGIAHEIQNPLNFVNNFSELSNDLINDIKSADNEEERNELYDELKNNLSKINFHGKRADSIVKSMLLHSRSGTSEKASVDINRLCEEYLNLAYHGMRANDSTFNCSMEKQLDNNIGRIKIIPQDISRVLLNLFNNALYAVKEKKLQESVHPPEAEIADEKNKKRQPYMPMVSVITQMLNHSILIRVRDNGGGIPDDVKAKIFTPFFTTKPTGEGTGLGLSLSHDIVKAHGGEIKVNDEIEDGTEFLIRLPLN